MSISLKSVISLVAVALRDVAQVQLRGLDQVRLDLPDGSHRRFRVVPVTKSPQKEGFQKKDPEKPRQKGPLHLGDPPDPILWAMKRSSRAEREILRRANQSFVSLDGAVRIKATGLFVDRSDVGAFLPPSRKPTRSAFSDRASNVARELFALGPGEERSIADLAEATGVAPSVASYAVKDLEYRKLVRVNKRRRRRRVRLIDRMAMVTEWSREYEWRDNIILEVGTPVESVKRFLFRIRSELSDIQWAVTLHAGASVMATRTPVEHINIYVDLATEEEIWHLARNMNWNPEVGGKLRIWAPKYKTAVWKGISDMQGIPVVSPLQLILDLWNHPDKGKETAEMLMGLM